MSTSIPPLHLNLADSAATEALGAALGRAYSVANAGAVVYLDGELGAGKTTCVRSMLRALGVQGPVRSPTYTLLDTYDLAGLTCIHIDLYRVQSAREVEELGLRDLLGPGHLMLIEWPEKGGAAVPRPDLKIALRYEGEARAAAIAAHGSVGQAWLFELGRDSRLTPYVSNLT